MANITKSPGTVAVPDKKVETVRKHVAEPDTEIEPARIKRRKSQSSNSEDLNKQPLSPLNDSAQKSKSSPKLQSAKQTDSLVSKPSEPVKTGGNAASSPKERQKGKALAVQSPTSQKRLRGDSAQDEKPKKKTRIGGNLDEGQALASSSSQTQSQAVSAQDEEVSWHFIDPL